jgi:hypothetical protein
LATSRALQSPLSGCSTAAGNPMVRAICSAARWNARCSVPRQSAYACTPATANPVAANAASVMCTTCGPAASLNIAATGSTFTISPLTSSNPAGAFIHAFAHTTKAPLRAPLTATTTPAAKWARGGMRFQA